MILKELFDKIKKYIKRMLPIVVITYLTLYALFNGLITELINVVTKFYMDALSFIPNKYIRFAVALILLFWAIKACYNKFAISTQKDMTKITEEEKKK